MAALYVGDLHSDVTEPMLVEKFSPAGPIHSIRLCRDRKTGSSLGYAYINFQHQADAERALEELNFELLMGQPMRIMWSQRDSSLRKTGIGNLFIKNLDKSIDSMALSDTFSIFGKVLSCKVVRYEKGSKGYGYVHYKSAEAADLAMERLNGKLLNGRKVFIEHFKSREERKAETDPRPQVLTNIYIKNFGDEMNNKELKDIFSKFGPVVSARVMTDENEKSRRFGFVRFERHEDAQRAVDEMNGKELNGNKVYVGQAQNKVERQAELKHKYEQGLNLYVKNLDGSVDDERLRTEFSPFGTIINAKVMMENGRSKGFGFVHFLSPEQAMNAIKWMNGRLWGRKVLYVGVAQRKEERQAYLAHQNIQRMASMQTEKLAPNYASSQVVEMTFPHCTVQTIQPQYVHHMPSVVQNTPDVIQFATTHQQTYGIFTLTTSQVPCLDEVCTSTTTPTAADSIPVADTVPAVDAVPAVDTVIAVDTVPAVDMVTAVDTVPAVDKVTAVDTVPAVDTVIAVDTVPAVDTVIAVDTVPAVDTVIAVDTVPAVDTVIAVDTVPAVDTVIAVDTVPAVDTVIAVDTVPDVDTVIAVDTVPAVDTVIAVDTVPDVDTVIAVDTVPDVDTVIAVDTVPAVDMVTAVATVPTVKTVIAVDTVPAVDTVIAVDAVPTADTVANANTVPAVDTVPGLVPAAGTGQPPADNAAPEPAPAAVPSPPPAAVVVQVPADDAAPEPEADEDTPSSTSTASDVPTYPSAGKVLTIYMLESAPVDDQIQMAHDYMLPLVEKIHPTLANKITWMLLEGENNYEIMNMIGDPELLRGRVDEMDALLKAREAGHKPETLKMFYNNNNKRKKKRKKK